jgi:DNA ligase (NAD+)
LKGDKIPHAEIRGEVFLSRTQFKRINEELEMQGEKTFANPRNCASGTLRMLDSPSLRHESSTCSPTTY